MVDHSFLFFSNKDIWKCQAYAGFSTHGIKRKKALWSFLVWGWRGKGLPVDVYVSCVVWQRCIFLYRHRKTLLIINSHPVIYSHYANILICIYRKGQKQLLKRLMTKMKKIWTLTKTLMMEVSFPCKALIFSSMLHNVCVYASKGHPFNPFNFWIIPINMWINS